MLKAQPDPQTVTPEGEAVTPWIAGVKVRPALTHPDERGEVCEIFNPAWGFHDEPMVYAYQICIRPHKVKGWVVHREQDDRLFMSLGTVKIVLYDDRSDSPTYGMINEVCLGERNRALITIPKSVYHAIQNVGDVDAVLINLPTRPYNHAKPDKFRLPLDTDQIPYRFEDRQGW
jgi:dTDP-4-dehydrorhamnose 3,5-epimerase